MKIFFLSNCILVNASKYRPYITHSTGVQMPLSLCCIVYFVNELFRTLKAIETNQ